MSPTNASPKPKNDTRKGAMNNQTSKVALRFVLSSFMETGAHRLSPQAQPKQALDVNPEAGWKPRLPTHNYN
jgi:hypothetical protein